MVWEGGGGREEWVRGNDLSDSGGLSPAPGERYGSTRQQSWVVAGADAPPGSGGQPPQSEAAGGGWSPRGRGGRGGAIARLLTSPTWAMNRADGCSGGGEAFGLARCPWGSWANRAGRGRYGTPVGAAAQLLGWHPPS